jgi:hypothetical protein
MYVACTVSSYGVSKMYLLNALSDVGAAPTPTVDDEQEFSVEGKRAAISAGASISGVQR